MREDLIDISDERLAPIRVAIVDDEGTVFKEVYVALDAPGNITIRPFLKVDEFASAEDEDFSICILDAFFDNESHIRELVSIAKSKWPGAARIILSNYADLISPSIHRSVHACIAKPDFLLEPSVLRSSVIEAIRVSDAGLSISGERAISSLLEVDRRSTANTHAVTEIRNGSICYPLRNATTVVYGAETYSLRGLESVAVGRAETFAQSKSQFVRTFHRRFQLLRSKRTEQRSDNDRDVWQAICNVVDVDEYEKMRTSVTPIEIAKVTLIGGEEKIRLEWWGGRHHGEVSVVLLEHAPTGLALFGSDEWLQAIVERNAITFDMVRLLDVTRIDDPRSSPNQRETFWREMDSTR